MFNFVKNLSKGKIEISLERLEDNVFSRPPQYRACAAIYALYFVNVSVSQENHIGSLTLRSLGHASEVSKVIGVFSMVKDQLDGFLRVERSIMKKVGAGQVGFFNSPIDFIAPAIDFLIVSAGAQLRSDLAVRARDVWQDGLNQWEQLMLKTPEAQFELAGSIEECPYPPANGRIASMMRTDPFFLLEKPWFMGAR